MVQHRRGPWTQTEDSLLKTYVNQLGPSNWVRISQMIGSRSPKQCRERYHQNLKPGLVHSPITEQEGQMIEDLVRVKGKRWAEIARMLPGRSDNAVKNWYNGGVNRRKRAVTAGKQRSSLSPSDHHHSSYHHHHLQGQLPLPANFPPEFHHHNLHYNHPRRPQPLDLSAPSFHSYSTTATPYPSQPSPGGLSTISMDAPSLTTDSSSRSPRTPLGAPERRNSAPFASHLPAPSVVEPYDEHSTHQNPSACAPGCALIHPEPYIAPIRNPAGTLAPLPSLQPMLSGAIGPADPLNGGRRTSTSAESGIPVSPIQPLRMSPGRRSPESGSSERSTKMDIRSLVREA